MPNEFRVRKGLVVNGSGSVILDVQGSQGQLFSVTDQLSGSLFAVSDASGIPVLEAFSDTTVKLGLYGAEAIIVSGSNARMTGSLFGTASWASNAITASNALTSSFVLNAVSASFAATASSVNPLVQNVQITGSLNLSGSQTIALIPTASSVRGTLSMGGGPFNGTTSGFFAGTGSGTTLAINETGSFSGDLISAQVAGSSRFRLSSAGIVTMVGVGPNNGNPNSNGSITFYNGANSSQATILASNANELTTTNPWSRNGVGDFTIRTNTGTILMVSRNATDVSLTTRGASGQTADLLQLQNSSGLVQSHFDATGSLLLGTPSASNGAGILQARGNIVPAVSQSNFTLGTSIYPWAGLVISGSAIITGSLTAPNITGSLFGTASWALNSTTASFVLNAVSASFAATASSADDFLIRQNATASNLLVNNTITAQTLVVQTITSSVDFVTGSTRFGSLLTDTHQFTGSVSVTGSLSLNDSPVITAATFTPFSSSVSTRITDLESTASVLTTASASFALVSSSYSAFSQSYNTGSFTGSFTGVGNLTGSLFGTSSWSLNAITASNALTASFVPTSSLTGNFFVQGGNSFGAQALLGTNDNQDLAFETSGSTRMFISSSGNIGINVINPTAQLDISGSARVRSTLTINYGTTNRTTQLRENGLFISRTSDGGYASTITADGSMTYNTRNSHIFQNDSTTTMTLTDNTRNVLIGTTSDSGFRLDVNGTARINGNTQITGSLNVNGSSARIGYSYGGTIFANGSWGYAKVGTGGEPTIAMVSNVQATTQTLEGVTIPATGSALVFSSTYGYNVGNDYQIISVGKLGVRVNNTTQVFTIPTSGIVTVNQGLIVSGSTTLVGSLTVRGNQIITGSSTATGGYTGSLFGTASWALNSITASNATTASFVLNAVSASFAATASSADDFLIRQNATASNLLVSNTITAQTLVVQTITSSVDFVTGSTRFGTLLTNTHQFTGSVSVTGSLSMNDSPVVTDSTFTPFSSSVSTRVTNLESTASVLTTASASFALVSSSYAAFSQSYNTGSFTGSFTGTLIGTASWASNATTASFVLNAVSASFATTASFLLGNVVSASFAATASSVNPLIQNVQVTGSLFVSSSNATQLLVGSSSLFVSSSGNVGIGNTTPSNRLDILGINNVISRIRSTTNTGASAYLAENDVNSTYEMGMWGSTRTPFGSIDSDNAYLYGGKPLAITSLVAIKFGTGLSVAERMRIDVNGNVGIGSTSPVYLLDVAGTLRNTGNAFLATGGANVGIGTTVPTTRLDVSGGARITSNLTVSGSTLLTGSLTLIGNEIITGSSTATGGYTGSLFGTASWAQNVISSSYAATASVLLGSVVSASFASTASSVNTLNQPVLISGSFTVFTGSAVEFQVTNTGTKIGNLASDIHTITGSIYQSGSTVAASLRGSGSAVFSVDGTSGRLFQVDDSLSGSLFSVNTAAGLPIIEAFSDNTVRIAQFGQRAFFVSQSVVGIGKESLLNGKLDVSGSTFITGSLSVSQGITGSLFGTASWAQNVISASFAGTASVLLGSVVSASFAATASSVNPLVQNVLVTGSLFVSSSNQTQLQVGSNLLFVSNSAQIGINTITPANTLDVNGTARIQSSAYFATSAGSVGIGTTSPTGRLTIQRASAGASTDIDFLNEAGQGPKAKIRFGGTNEELSFWTGGTASERMRIASDGNVGIGTTSPIFRLDVSGSSRIQYKTLTSTESSVIIGDNIAAGTGAGRSKVIIGNTSGNSELLVGQGATNSLLFNWTYNATPANAYGVLETYGGNNPLVLQSAGGNVGIGTISPTTRLDVSGGARITSNLTVSGSTLLTGSFTLIGNEIITGSSTATGGYTGSLFGTSSWALNAVSSSFAATASSADNFFIRQNATASNLLVSNTITAQTLVVQTVTSSVSFITGSTKFGSLLTNTHEFTGSVSITGSLSLNDSPVVTNATFTPFSSSVSTRVTNLESTASVLTTASASFALVSSSYAALSSSFRSGSFTGSFTGTLIGTASWASNATTASFVLNAVSSSFASTASFVPTSSLVGNFFVQGGNSFGAQAVLGTNDAQSLAIRTNGSTRIAVDSAGNVGIGTTTPGAFTLDVSGSARVQSFTTINAAPAVNGEGALNVNATTNNSTGGQMYGINSTATVATNTGNVTGINSAVNNSTTATNMAGFNSAVNVSANTTAQVRGYSVGGAVTGTGTVTAYVGYDYVDVFKGGSGAVSRQFGLRIANLTAGSTANIGILFNNAANTGVGGTYDIYSQTGNASYLSGSLGIGPGKTSPTANLDISGSTLISGSLRTSGSFTLIGNEIITGSSTATGGYTGSLFGTASWAQNVVSASFAATASSVNTLNQNVIITGSLTVGLGSVGPSENTLTLGPRSGTGEGGQLGLQAQGGTYTSASMLDNYQDRFRILRGNNAGSDAEIASFSMHTKQFFLPSYNSVSAYPGTAVAYLGVNSSGDVITISAGTVTSASFASTASFVNPLSQTVILTGSLNTTGSVFLRGLTTSSQANVVGYDVATGQLYYQAAAGGGGSSVTASYALTASAATDFTVRNTITLDRSLMDYATVASSVVGSNNLFTQATGSYSSAFFKYTAANGANARSGEVMAVWNAASVQFTDNSTLDIGSTTPVTCSVSVVGTDVQFNVQTNTSGWTIKSVATYM